MTTLYSEQTEAKTVTPNINIYFIYTAIENDYDEDGDLNVTCNELWFPGELDRNQVEIYVQTCKPGSILIDFTQRGNHDEF